MDILEINTNKKKIRKSLDRASDKSVELVSLVNFIPPPLQETVFPPPWIMCD
jgi:hypothetical protein